MTLFVVSVNQKQVVLTFNVKAFCPLQGGCAALHSSIFFIWMWRTTLLSLLCCLAECLTVRIIRMTPHFPCYGRLSFDSRRRTFWTGSSLLLPLKSPLCPSPIQVLVIPNPGSAQLPWHSHIDFGCSRWEGTLLRWKNQKSFSLEGKYKQKNYLRTLDM